MSIQCLKVVGKDIMQIVTETQSVNIDMSQDRPPHYDEWREKFLLAKDPPVYFASQTPPFFLPFQEVYVELMTRGHDVDMDKLIDNLDPDMRSCLEILAGRPIDARRLKTADLETQFGVLNQLYDAFMLLYGHPLEDIAEELKKRRFPEMLREVQ